MPVKTIPKGTSSLNEAGQEVHELEIKDTLKKESQAQELESYKEGEINWIDNDFWDTYDKIKGHAKVMLRHKTEYTGEETKLFFLSHFKDTIAGKPQLIDDVQKKIPLVRKVIKHSKEKKDQEETEIQSFYFFDEKYDKRYDGYQTQCLALDFFMYRVVTADAKEYYILSTEKLPAETCIFKGMGVEMDDFAELSKSMKIKALSRIFFLKGFELSRQLLTPEKMIEFSKEKKITEEQWFRYLGAHPSNSINRFPKDTELLKSAFILAGKKDGYPLHVGILGPTGTKKSFGYIEATAHKFAEDYSIVEGANSRIKGLSPSFKEKPANIGYLAACERIGFIDEVGKMVDDEYKRHQAITENILAELNFLLDHKRRTVSSGNDNQCEIQANSKFMLVSNPCSSRSTIYEHVGLIDPTTMSRILWWVQDKEEQEFVLSAAGIESPPTHKQDSIIYNNNNNTSHEKVLGGVSLCVGGDLLSRDEFLILFDSCYSFTCKIDLSEVQRLADTSIELAKEPMKSVWRPRALHHVFLLVDGICKHRSLFKDYDCSFTATPEDYTAAERILVRMVHAWDTDLGTEGV